MRTKTPKLGRPRIIETEKEIIFRKLEPYLKAGLSLHKACLEAKLPKSTVYDLNKFDLDFAEKIKASQNYISILTSSILVKELNTIAKKQKKESLSKDDREMVKWIAVNHIANRDEFATRVEVAEQQDKETALDKALNDSKTKEGLAKAIEKFVNKHHIIAVN